MLSLDHIAIACTDLSEGTRWAEQKLGVQMQPGGKHIHFGTHNTLLGMGDIYLEVIACDPDAPATGRPTWFGLDHFDGPPRLCNWICRADDLAVAPHLTGPPLSLSRGDLNWQLTVPEDGSLPKGGAFPTLLKWSAGITPPAARLPDSGVRLTRLQVAHPDADCIARMVKSIDPHIQLVPGNLCLTAIFRTPGGIVTLKSH